MKRTLGVVAGLILLVLNISMVFSHKSVEAFLAAATDIKTIWVPYGE